MSRQRPTVKARAKRSSALRIQPEPGDTLANSVRRRIGDEILEGTLPPGAPLDEQSIADRFGVSRTPVREALKQLAAAGLVLMPPHRNAVVAALNERRLEALFEATAAMECWAVRLATGRMTLVERHRLQLAHEEGARALSRRDPDAYSLANRHFHQLIFDCARNEFLSQMSDVVRYPAAPYRKAQFSLADRMSSSHKEHGEILNTVLRGDADAAALAMQVHLSSVVRTVFSRLKQNEQGDLGRLSPRPINN